jgi:glycosyltransferase involved in cell wall biosynthesis
LTVSKNIPDISVVLLCYRSEKEIYLFVDRLKSSLEDFSSNWEIVLVGNYIEGIPDKTPEIVQEIADKEERIIAVTQVKEGMMGWDMHCGLDAAQGKTIAVIDGDGQMPLEDVGRVYKALIDQNMDMVKTFRTDRQDGFYRRTISKVYNLIFNLIFPGMDLHDVNSKPKIIKREFYERMHLESDDWFADAEIMIQARRLKMNILEIPTTFHKILSRPSFVKPWAILEFIFNLFIYRLREFIHFFKR